MAELADLLSGRRLRNETDCISVNGIASESISIQEDRRSAEFTFLKGFESALYAAYPASVVSKYESGALTLLLPNVQTWSESDQFDPAAAVMLAQAADGASLRFRHAMAYLRYCLPTTGRPCAEPFRQRMALISGR